MPSFNSAYHSPRYQETMMQDFFPCLVLSSNSHNQDAIRHYRVRFLKPKSVSLELLCPQALHTWVFAELGGCTLQASSTQEHLEGCRSVRGGASRWLGLIFLHCDVLTLLQLKCCVQGPWLFRHGEMSSPALDNKLSILRSQGGHEHIVPMNSKL